MFYLKYKSDEEFYPLNENGELEIDNTDYCVTWKCLENIYRKGKVKGMINLIINEI